MNAVKQDPTAADAKESTTIRFEWTLRNLKNLFENSLYLACEPTAAEKDNSVNGKWSREGLFNFGFEIRNVSKTMQFNAKDAHDHSFHYPGAQNWGWAQFAKRDAVYYQATTVKSHDAFVIICTITSSPAIPAPVPPIPRYPVPRDLLDSMGGMLDDPLYSDVEFVLPQRGKGPPRKIYAARRLLQRVDYFYAMFGSGFAESASDLALLPEPPSPDDASVSDAGAFAQQFDDSDFEDDDVLDNDGDFPIDDSDPPADVSGPPPNEDDDDDALPSTSTGAAGSGPSSSTVGNKRASVEDDETSETNNVLGLDAADEQEQDQDQSARNTRPKLSHPSTPRTREMALERETQVPSSPLRTVEILPVQVQDRPPPEVTVPGPTKARVVVKDVAYTTYRAVLYYIYTDTITFAPLSSTFLASSPQPPPGAAHTTSATSTPAALASETQIQPPSLAFARTGGQQSQSAASSADAAAARSRRDWIADWERENPDRPRPPSAKSVYRLADKLELQDLKERAFQHIVRSLTVDNVMHEAFSAFSAAFEDVRKVEVNYMFEHWLEVRKGPLLNIGQQLRFGRFPGFEEVWPTIIQNLITDDRKGDGDAPGRA
ncbi:hypothetical protein GSI_15604 [Ganoderma sinense ZZ0214-1]|uniref:MATH domain-containing protein n=1 Tax=Ganoderma sinense ZZ0214-1 TaxID=1077348 RepID=A0A2G8RNL5_9APHY|nr:hypothetical protein GSI_15604 [Ganoderma sinense ZZ0214-1]